jgi:hypothetical protein
MLLCFPDCSFRARHVLQTRQRAGAQIVPAIAAKVGRIVRMRTTIPRLSAQVDLKAEGEQTGI